MQWSGADCERSEQRGGGGRASEASRVWGCGERSEQRGVRTSEASGVWVCGERSERRGGGRRIVAEGDVLR